MGIPPLYQVGALARRCKVTIRTLHHYDEIGLIKPAARTQAGYRLYAESAVEQINAIQTLQETGLSLESIKRLLTTPSQQSIEAISIQLSRIDEDMALMKQRKAKLSVLAAGLTAGIVNDRFPWPNAVTLLEHYRKAFTEAELLKILGRWALARNLFERLIEELQAVMAEGLDYHKPKVQRLAARWMDAAMLWMDGDIEVARRWSNLHEKDHGQRDHVGLDTSLLAYITPAIELRMDALRRHLTEEDILSLDKRLAREWSEFGRRADQLLKAGDSVSPLEIDSLITQYHSLVDKMTRGNCALARKLQMAYRCEPILQIGHPVPARVREWLGKHLQKQA
ncbi:MerR family transcriptional regulator [Pseudomonas sp. MH2]|uniref:MerR family transcriptional regulator n=1 Tax=Pseudomonas machongensis TaxID=3110229 RepID=A0ABU5VAW6_9PSED|nr:MerR family transcriptional regulator [Pseudomonas sp. MH2]MEA5670510.1 MerR family transcriptional regulator [Pseudomonas sp. MH2]